MLQGEQKKTRPAREDRPHDTVLEEDLLIQVKKNSQTPTLLIHSGPSPVRKAELLLCFGYGIGERIFLVQAGSRTPALLVPNYGLSPAGL